MWKNLLQKPTFLICEMGGTGWHLPPPGQTHKSEKNEKVNFGT